MKLQIKILTIVLLCILIISVSFLFFFSQEAPPEEEKDTIPPEITSITGNLTATAGQSTTISAQFSDNTGIISAELFYRTASAIQWSSKSILSGNASIILSSDALENLFYYIIVDDAAGNGPVGDPSVDGSLYYVITVLNNTDENNNDGSDNGNGDNTNQTHTGYIFLELPKPKISCSECPKIAAMVDELFDSGDYPFYYVTLPQANEKAAARITEYNVYGYPSIYVDGGYGFLTGGTIQKSMIIDKIQLATARQHANLSTRITAERKENSSEITLKMFVGNPENQVYNGQVRVYLTEIVSTTEQGNSPTRFALLDYLIDEQIQIPANDNITFNKIVNISGLDAENLMIFGVVFNSETHVGYSKPPDEEPFNAHYVDAVDATTVVKNGNLPPEVGIQTPTAKYLYRFGKQIRKTFSKNTILIGKTTIVAYAKDDSKVVKVEFYVDDTLMQTLTNEPYEWIWHQFTMGKKTITVQAYDDQGKSSTATIDVHVFMKWPGLFSHTR
jgi:hypothetical protein